ncbi:TadE/TadG family type IV pilus assembly protein [Alsobacter metallidurans]|nr:TadE/TadG family type IV pilus assembly protein [Alsobacter metallidurans]
MTALMTRLRHVPALRRVLSAASDTRGVAAVEFALILPVMLVLYIGSVEVSQGLSADRKVVLLTRTLADLVTQNDTLNSTQVSQIMSAGTAVMSPMAASPIEMRITSVAISDVSGKEATACWSQASTNWSGTPASAFPKGYIFNTIQVPTALRADPGTSVVLAEVRYPYKPVMGYVITSTLTLSERIFMRPRIAAYVSNTDVANSGKPTAASGPCT